MLQALAQGLTVLGERRACHQLLARIYSSRQEWEPALAHWQWLRNADPRSVEPQLQVARALLQLRRYTEAADAFRRVLRLQPRHAEATSKLAFIAALSPEMMARASAVADSPAAATTAAPPEPVTPASTPAAPAEGSAATRPTGSRQAQQLLERAREAYKAGNHAASRQLFERALKAGADAAICHKHLAKLCNALADPAGALVHWTWLDQQSPGTVAPRLQMARALLRLKRFDDARQAFEAVLARSPDHAEARQRLAQLSADAAAPDVEPEAPAETIVVPAAEPAAAPAVSPLVEEGREAFRRGDHAHAESLFRHALQAGGDELVCRQHLARIYNHLNDAAGALEQWRWLHAREPDKLEPVLQVARAQIRLGRLTEAATSLREVLRREPGHGEAAERLGQVEALLQERADGTDGNWLTTAPETLRWRLAGDVLGAEIGALDALVERTTRQVEAVGRAAAAMAGAAGKLATHRELYGLQMGRRVEDLTTELRSVAAAVRDLSRRTEKMFAMLDRTTGSAVAPLRAGRAAPPRVPQRRALLQLGLALHAEQGLEPLLGWLWREVPADDRPALLGELVAALRDQDRDSAVHLSWLAYAAEPSPAAENRLGLRLFQIGDLSTSAVLLAKARERGATPSLLALHTTLALFRDGVRVPPRAPRAIVPRPGRIGYVVSGSLPFQVAGYTVRSQALLAALQQAGFDPIAFTQPGFPWNRPKVLDVEQPVEAERVIDGVRYRHTPWPQARPDGATALAAAAEALAGLFRAEGIEIVQAASNSRNALPALLAARAVGAPFVYEVRGLWELTAAARFPGRENTERYRFDSELEITVAREADHVLAITRGLAEELMAGGVPPDRISLLPNAVDPAQFAPLPRDSALAARLGLQDDEFVLVYAGTLSGYEGLDDLIAALPLLVAEGVRPRLVLAGEGEYRDTLEAVAHRCGVADRVVFVGRVAPEAVRGFLSLADAVPLPRKPFRVCEVVSPLKPFEAMAMEKAVIVSDLPVLREIVEDGRTGLVCRPADPADLAAVLLRLARDPALGRELGRAARAWVIAERSWASNAATLAALYARLNAASDAE